MSLGILALVISVGASVIGGIVMSVTGFGFGAVAMSILPHFLPYSQAVALSSLCGLSTAAMISIPNFRHINFRILAPCAFFGLTAAYLSVMFSLNVKASIMIKALGLLLIAVAIYSAFLGGKIKIKPTVLNGSIAGFLGGAGAGMFSVGGPPVAVYLLACTDDNEVYRATICTHFCFTSFTSAMTRFQQGIITGETFKIWIFMLLGIALGIFLGNKIFHRLNAKRLRLVVYAYLAFSGLTMLFK